MISRNLRRPVRRAASLGTAFLRGLPEHLARGVRAPSPSVFRRIVEQRRLLWSRGLGADEYYLHGLDRPDMPWASKLEFLGESGSWDWQTRLNVPAYHYLTENKLILKRVVAELGLPVPRLLAVVGPGGRAEGGAVLGTPQQAVDWLEAERIEHVVLKPMAGSMGHGILVLGPRRDDGRVWARIPSGMITAEGIVAHLERYAGRQHFLVEERVRPHSMLAAFAPDVAHTVRIITVLDVEVRIVAAALRIGTGTGPTDNFSQGNLMAAVDIATGTLGAAAARAPAGVRHRVHPVTGASIEGVVLPHWNRTLDVVRRAATALPYSRSLGWDVALTEDGPVILEANDDWGLKGIQLALGRGLLSTRLGPWLIERRLIS